MNSLKSCPNCLYVFGEKDVYGGKCHCPKCGGCFGFGNEISDEINEGYRLLGNLNFEDADDIAEKLLAKDSANAEAWFLKVLASNRVCYCDNDNKDLWHYDKIPTLNDVGFSDIKKSDYAVNALKYAVTEEQTARFNEVFDYLEKVRAKSAEVINSHKYDYDVFISVKVSAINPETKQPITDANGNVYKTRDYEYARELHDKIKETYPGCKVFLSELMKTELVGKEYEPIIFAALRSAKVMILVGDSNFNIEWPWVKNEWKRYLYWKDNLNDGKERNFVFMALNPNIDYPQAFRAIQAIKATDLNASERLFLFLDNVLAKNESKKLDGKTFDGKVSETIGSAVASEIGKKSLNRYAPSQNAAIDRRITSVIYNLEDTSNENDYAVRVRRRKNCFDELRAICSSNRDAHRAQLYLLLEKSNSVNFNDFFFDTTASAEDKKKFFDIADEKEALAVINHIVAKLTDNNGADCDISAAQVAFTDAIAPHFDNIDKGDLKNLSKSISSRTSKELSAMRGKSFGEKEAENVLKYARCNLWLKQFLADNSPRKYVEDRESLLEDFGGITPNAAFTAEIEKICTEIAKVQKGNVYALWYGIEPKLFKTIESPKSLFAEYNSKDDFERIELFREMLKNKSGIIVHNKAVIDSFKELFSYAPEKSADMFDKKTFLLFFLELIIRDELSYEKTPEGTIAPSRGKRDEDLNGYDLFSKYIEYDLGENKSLESAEYYEIDSGEYASLEPTYSVSALKCGRTPVDVMLSYFAISLQEHGLFNEAISMYKLYLGQQSKQDREDCILIKFYIILCQNKCRNTDEQRVSPSKVDVGELTDSIVGLIDYYNNLLADKDFMRNDMVSKTQKLRKTLSDFADKQNVFADEAKQVGTLIDSLPACNTANCEVYSLTAEKIHDVINRKSVGSDFDKGIADRLKVSYKDEIAKLDWKVATLKKMVTLQNKIFKEGYSAKAAWACAMRSGVYKLDDFEKDLDYLKQNESFLDPSQPDLGNDLAVLQQKIKDKRVSDKRDCEERIRREEEEKKFAAHMKVFGKIMLVLLMISSKLLVALFVYKEIEMLFGFRKDGVEVDALNLLNGWYVIYLCCAVFDFVSMLVFRNVYIMWEGIYKFQCIISLIYIPLAIVCGYMCLSCVCSCAGGYGSEFMQFFAIAAPAIAVAGTSIFCIQDW